jgi:hypothetical protein
MSIQIDNLAQAEFLQELTTIDSSTVVGGNSYSYSYDSTPITAPFFPSISFGSIGSSATANFTTTGSTFIATPFSFGFTDTPINFSLSIPVINSTIGGVNSDIIKETYIHV